MPPRKRKRAKKTGIPRRRYLSQSKSTRFEVRVYYKGFDASFDEALYRFARLHGMGIGGSGCWLVGKDQGMRDISFCCGVWEKARRFLEQIRMRFKVRAKLTENPS